jgi:signal transduction histidine kinase
MNQKTLFSPIVKFAARYGTAILLVSLALSLNLFIWIFIKAFASPLFLLAIMIVARRHGLRAGLLATVLSGVCIDYFFVNPQYQLSGSWDDISRLVIFAFEGYILCWMITAATKAAEENRRSREELQALSLRQHALREEERRRISLEIHDELGQALTGLKMEIRLLDKQVKGANNESSAAIGEKMGGISDLIDTTILTVRRIATELRPPILDDLGLVAAIEWQTQEFQKRTGITCVLSANVDDIELDAEYTTAVFRIFQETLTNIIRHAEANTAIVNLKKLNEKLVLRVEDDGKGIQIENIPNNGSLGILGMRERARIIGGELEVFNGDENGTIVLLTIPMV